MSVTASRVSRGCGCMRRDRHLLGPTDVCVTYAVGDRHCSND